MQSASNSGQGVRIARGAGRARVRAPWILVILLMLSGQAGAYRWYETEETGAPLRWFRSALSYRVATVQPEEVTWDALVDACEGAFSAWTELSGCAIPAVTFAGPREVSGRTVPRSLRDPPDNVIVMVRSGEAWAAAGYSPSWIAITSVAHDQRTGEIVDADIEVNDAGFAFSTSAPPVDGHVDLVSTLTHEIGHFFGMDHSQAPEATMFATYNSASNPLAGRSLDQDDIDGICALYADVPASVPEPPEPEGCGAGGRTPGSSASALGLLIAWVWARRRRRSQTALLR